MALEQVANGDTGLSARTKINAGLTATDANTTSIAAKADSSTVAAALATKADSSAVTAALAGYQPLDSDLTAIAGLSTTSFGRSVLTQADAAALRLLAGESESIIIAAGDETTAITTGTAKVTFRMPYAFTLTAVRASVTTAPTGSTILIDINEGGSTILSTKLMIDASEKTSTTAATAAVISDTSLADDAEITIDFDQVGSTVAGAGVKVTLIGRRT